MSVLAVVFALVASAQTQPQPGPAAPPKAPASAPTRKAPKTPPSPVTSLDVTVTDPTGRPVEGAFVMALPTQGAYRPYGGIAPEKVRSTLTVPLHKDLDVGTIRAIYRQAARFIPESELRTSFYSD